MKQEKDSLKAKVSLCIPLVAGETSFASETKTRRNASSVIERTNRYTNIENGLVPFTECKNSNWDIRDAIILCQKAYYNFAIFRNTIDLMTEFSVNDIHFKKGSKKSRDFFGAWANKIGLWGLQDRFFREYYRSGNVIFYRLDAQLDTESFNQLTQAFGEETSIAGKKKVLPIKYVILNPADIQVGGSISFVSGRYYKLLSDYEVSRLKNPQTDEEKELLSSLDPETQKLIKNKSVRSVIMPLDERLVTAVFYKKQDYEPMAVPMGYPVLDDINWKAELKKMDMAMSRTTQQAILLITMGAELKDGTLSFNQKQAEAMQTIFQNESVGRVLIADYTTQAKFLIPDIASILDPKKYEIVDKDIQMGLNNILVGSDEKFSNQAIKVQVFIERLKQARKAFINDFLLPEIKRIAKSLGMKNYPIPVFEDFELRNELEYAKVYSRLVELGVLTPIEGIKALETGILPNEEESLENQQEFKKLKDKGFYEPIVGGPFSQQKMQDGNLEHQSEMVDKQAKVQKEANKEFDKQKLTHQEELHQQKVVHQDAVNKVKVSQMKGRPSGTSAPRKSPALATFSLTKFKDNLLLSQALQNDVESSILKKYKLKKLTEEQKELASQVSDVIIANENPENWQEKINDYIKNPIDSNFERIKEIEELAFEHQVNPFVASLLYASRKD